MSLQPAQTRPLQRVASRRNVVRSAAWTTAAVTVVVATPNIAAASTAAAPLATATSTNIVKWSDKNIKHVTWTIRLTNTGTTPITDLTGSFTYADNSGSPATALSLTSTSSVGGGSTTWGGASSSLVKTYSKTLMPGETLTLTGIYTSDNNAAGNVSVAFAAGSPSKPLASVTASF